MDNNNKSSRIVFEGEDFQRPRQSYQTPKSKITELVIRYSGGYIRDRKQANYFLVVFVVLAIIISLLLFFGGDGQELPPKKVMMVFLI